MPLVDLPVLGAPKIPAPKLRKIAIEEHFMVPEATNPGGVFDPAAFARVSGIEVAFLDVVMRRMADLRQRRIEEMDQAGIDIALLSLTAAGIEALPDAARARDAASKVNDFLADLVASAGGRFAGFASVPLQDPEAAARELERAIRTLGFKGVMVNGYVADADRNIGHYLDEDRFAAFWQVASDLACPVYIHPRASLPPVRDALYAGHPELAGGTWGFTTETATHALRLVYSGLFDRLPNLSVVLGHLGETIPYVAWRIQRCFEYNPIGHQVNKRLQDYLAENFYVSTSGSFNDQALICALLTIGADRIMFAVDYPFEMSDDAARWIERAPISEGDRRKIAHGNAARLFGLPA